MYKMIIQNRNNICGDIVKVEYLVTLVAVKGIGGKMHSPNVLGHLPLCDESLGKWKNE